MLRVFLVLVMVCVFGDGSLSGRGLFCRDPETGHLHPVNSTWTATSFCGTYHCKIRRKNITSTEYAPMRQINITDIQLLGENATIVYIQKGEGFVKKEDVMKNTVSTDNKTIPYLIDSETLKEIQGMKFDDDIDEKNTSDKDRYLSDKEIRSLTDILHTVKKGDLDAIVEIYNLAQDMYKELDQTSTDLILQEALSTAKTLEQKIVKSQLFKKVTKDNSASYWYEPLSNTKIRVADLAPPNIIRNDMSPDIPAMVISIKAPAANVTSKLATKISNDLPSPLLPAATLEKPHMRRGKDEFFNVPLSRNDFGKLPYYYPMSYFQRMSSYKHDQKKRVLDNARTEIHTLAPIQTTTPAPMPSWLPKLIPAIMRMPEFTEAWIPEYIPGRIPEAIQIPEPIPAQTQVWHPSRIPEPIPDQSQVRIPARIPARILEYLPARILESMPAQRRAWNPVPIPEPTPEHAPEHTQDRRIPSRIPVRIPAEPIPVRIGPSRKPIQIPAPIPVPPKSVQTLAPRSPHKHIKSKPINTGPRYLNELRPSIFLPYPFTSIQQQKKWSLMQSLYSGNNFGEVEMSRTKENSFKNKNTITREDNSNEIPSIKAHNEKQDNVVLMNPDLENFQDLQIIATVKRENVLPPIKKEEKRKTLERRKPAWQTDPIPKHIMDEVRANIQENHRAFIHNVPFRKKVKLERVGKLFSIDQLARTKRAAEATNTTTEAVPLEPEIFEVFIEKTTCDSDYSVPGFFRFGNLSEPYPQCCPQRIPVR